MAREFKRSERVADFIRRELSVILQQSLRDPRVEGVNVNDVAVSSDLSQARIYVTFMNMPDEQQTAEAVEVLNGASGFLRSELASKHSMRSTPKLRFYFDESVRTGDRLSKLIDQALNKDGAV